MGRENLVWIKLPNILHNNYGIEISCDDPEIVRRFIESIPDYFPADMFKPFFQGGSNNPVTQWAYFEFWTSITGEMQDELLARAEAIALVVGLPLTIK